MEDNKATVGFPVMGIAFLIFLLLKLNPGGHLSSPVEDWSWWIITAPLWAPVALVFLILGFMLVVTVALGGRK